MLGAPLVVLLLLQAVPVRPGSAPRTSNPAFRALADRGAVLTVHSYTDARTVSVSFPLGSAIRKWRKEHDFPIPLCGMGVEFELEPSDTGPPMTDTDMVLLDRIRGLTFVDLSGTEVTQEQVQALRKRLPRVRVLFESELQ